MTVEARAPRVLIVEDNETLALGLRRSFEVEGYYVSHAGDGPLALDWLAEHSADLIILDLMLPGMSGIEVLRRHRATGGTTAVLILSARGEETSKLQGFRVGADDYVVKPVGVLELLARAGALLRRAAPPAPAQPTEELDGLTIDFKKRQVHRDGALVDLSPMEFDLLAFMLRSGGDIISRETLMREVWRYSPGLSSRTVDQHIARLRHKIEREPTEPRHIITVRKAGYRFER